MNFSGNLTRRTLLGAGKRLLFIIAGWKFLSWPKPVYSKGNFHSQLTELIGYLLYGNHQPSHIQEEIGKQVQERINNSLEDQLHKEIFSKADLRNFTKLLPKDKRVAVKQILPELLEHPEILGIINNCLKGDRTLQYLDYPDLPGEFGECGWLVLEGSVWDRYYPQ
jgi:hypothetical protein